LLQNKNDNNAQYLQPQKSYYYIHFAADFKACLERLITNRRSRLKRCGTAALDTFEIEWHEYFLPLINIFYASTLPHLKAASY
jgi:hypothetical protein